MHQQPKASTGAELYYLLCRGELVRPASNPIDPVAQHRHAPLFFIGAISQNRILEI